MTRVALVAGCLACLALALFFLVAALRRRIRGPQTRATADHEPEQGPRRRRLAGVLRPQKEQELEALKNRVGRAGFYSRDAVDLYLTIRLSLIVGALVLAGVLAPVVGDPLLAGVLLVFFAGGAVVLPNIWLSIRIDGRHRQIGRVLPFTIDMLVMSLSAGLGLEQALERVSAESRTSDDLLARELRLTLGEIKAGLSTETAFRRLSARIGMEDVSTFAAVVSHGAAMGTNIGSLLRDHARTLRQHRLFELEEKAGKANAKLTLPLTLCLLPAVLALLIGPAVISIFGTF